MIDKLNNINAGNAQNKRVSDSSKEKVSSSSKTTPDTSDVSNKASNVKISSELNLKSMRSEAPIDTAKVSAIKEAISKGDYPIDLDKVADALLEAYKDIMTWANPGPGAMRGLNRIFGRPLDSKQKKPLFIQEMRELLALLNNTPLPLEMRDIEHCLCEFDKYERTRLGQGRPRSRYKPREYEEDIL